MNYLIQTLVPLNSYLTNLVKFLQPKPSRRTFKRETIKNSLSSDILNIITMQADNYYGKTIVNTKI